jgi:hypothetical protein
MQIRSATHTIISLVPAAVLGAALVGCAPAASDGGSGAERVIQREVEQMETRAEQYVGDPWERRFRQQFWTDQHIHDSWNRCHLGENAPRPPGCDGSSLTPRQ